jgi:hypothetical protein
MASPICRNCYAECDWSGDSWTCTNCGGDWYPDHGPEYSPPIVYPTAHDMMPMNTLYPWRT